ncbi:alpha-(1,6)-fucosyltransferase 8 isoform X2 [Lycorma delicatula]
MWYFISAQVKAAHKQAIESSPQLANTLNKIVEEGAEHKRSLIKDIESLADSDGHDKWRDKEAAELSDLVQRRIQHLQNPPNCSKARKLLCSLNKGCGYGCQLHHIVYCLIVAYGTERTMILKSKGWRYHRAGWEDIYKPVSNTCVDPSGTSTSHWPGTPNTQVVQLPIVDSIAPRPPYLPLSIPKDLAPRISRLHGNPFVWWVGQFFKYLLRPQPATKTMLDTAAEKLNFKKPIVGVHVRRTDKIGTEAAFHSVEEYMRKVEQYYEQLAMTQDVPVKRVYLASDDPKVFVDVRLKYPDYEIVGDSTVSKTAAVATRYSDSSLNGIIMDIHFLSLSDYLVCTFSSQVCRVAYEIMQSMYPDASDKFCSLDDIYYYGGQNTHRQIALMPHKARSPDQMDLELGDSVGAFGNHWDGYSMGRNLRTNQVGLYPSFKVQDLVEAVDFPTYTEVPLKESNNT